MGVRRMTTPTVVPYLQAVADEFRILCDRLDDADSVRGFLRNLHASLPADVLAWHCYAEDRITLSPQYRALSHDPRRAVDWGIVPVGRLIGRAGMPISLDDLESAAEFLRQCRDAVADDDDVYETAVNARENVLARIDDLLIDYTEECE